VSVGDSATTAFVRDLVRWKPGAFDTYRGVRDAVLVVAPLVIGFAIGYPTESVLVTLGSLNLLFVEPARPEVPRWRVLALAAVANTAAFGAGSLVGAAPPLLAIPLTAVGVFVAFLLSASPSWDGASFIVAVMFVFGIGLPVANAFGEAIRPVAVLVGGLFALAAVTAEYVAFPQPPLVGFGRPTPVLEARKPFATVAPHAAVVGATVAFGLFVGMRLDLVRDYWIMLTVIVALRLDLATTVAYSTARILGTIAGATVAYGVTTYVTGVVALFPLLALFVALAFATRAVNYAVYSVWVTLTVIVLLNLAYSLGPGLAIDRAIDTVIGGGLAFLASLVLWVAVHRPAARRPRPAGGT
jgi:hypothetical protein